MNLRLTALFAVLLAIAFAAAGYSIGTRHNGVDRVAVESIVQDALAKSKPAAPASMPVSQPMQTAELSDGQRKDVEDTIRNYLIANPEIVRDAIDALQQKEDAAAQVAQAATIKQNSAELFDSKREVVLGNPKGDVTLVELFDYNCTYCRQALPDLATLMADDPNLKVILKQFPILTSGSVDAARVGVLVSENPKIDYWQFHQKLFSMRAGEVGADQALQAAEQLGGNRVELMLDMNGKRPTEAIQQSYDLAKALDITGTPTYILGDEMIPGAMPLDQLKQKIANLRACGSTQCPESGSPASAG